MLGCLHVDEKYNAIPTDADLSSEDVEAIKVLHDGLVQIAALLNASIVDPNDISGMIDVIEGEIKQLQTQGKKLPWTLDDLPITVSTEGECRSFL